MSPTTQPLLRIAVVGGSGAIGKRHCQHVSSNPLTQLVAIVDPSPSALETATLHSTTVYPSVAALLASPDRVDAAILCTPNHTHLAVASQLASAGIHILCEKPISADVESGRRLVATAQAHRVRLLIGHHRRFNPYIITTKRLLSNGAIGAVTAVSGLWTVLKPASYFASAQAWRGQKSSGGGPVLLNFIHEIDLMHHLFGRVTRVHAEKTLSRRRPSAQEADAAEEGAAITMRFASGVVGTFVVSDNVASPHSFEGGTWENPTLAPTGADVYRIFGTEGTLSVPDMVLSTYGSGKAGWEHGMSVVKVEVENMHVAPFDSQLDHFVDVCGGAVTPRCTGEEGLRALVVCEAIRRALDMPGGGGTVEIGSMEINGDQGDHRG